MLEILFATFALFGGSPRAPVAPPSPAEYRCEIDWQTADSRFFVEANLSHDGRPRTYHFTWLRHSIDYRSVGWATQFDFEGDRFPAPGDDWNLTLRMDGFAPGARTVRVDLLRVGDNGVETVSLSNPRVRATPYISTRWSRDAVRAAFADAAELVVRVTDRRGRTRLSHRIPTSVLNGPAEAVAARRAEIEAWVAGYRQRCQFYPEGSAIVVT